MTTDAKIGDEKMRNEIIREVSKISTLSSGKLINMNILQGKKCSSIHLGLSVHFGSENYATKIDKTHKDFELYQVFIHNALSKNLVIPPNVYHGRALKVYP